MQSNYLLNAHTSELLRGENGLNGKEMCGLSQPVNYNPKTVVLFDGFWQSNHKIHGNVFPFPHRDWQGL